MNARFLSLSKRIALLLVVSVMASAASAVTYTYWRGPENGDWWTAANWTQGVPVGSTYVPRFSLANQPNAGTTVVVTNAAAIDCDYIFIMDGDWTIDLRGDLSIPGGGQDDPTISVDGSSTLKIRGGKLVNQSLRVSSGNGGGTAKLTFENCVTEGLYTLRRAGTDEHLPSTFTINGGVYSFRTWYPRLYDDMAVNDGLVTFGSIHGYDRYGEGKDIRVECPLKVNGGKVVVNGENAELTGGSCGICAADRGVVDITVGGNQIWLANSRGVKQTWRVQDKALFQAVGPYVANGTATGNVEVVGGRFVMKSTFANYAGSNEGRYSTFLVDGGILEFDYASSGSLGGSKSDVAGTEHKLIAGENGARLRNASSATVTVSNSGFQGEGEVTYDGLGKFIISGANTHTGGTVIRGLVQPSIGSGCFGTGDVTVRDGGLLDLSAADQTLPTVKTTSGATLNFDSKFHATASALVGTDQPGVLTLSTVGANVSTFGQSGADCYFALTTAPELDSLGLPTVPVVMLSMEPNNSADEAHLVTFDTTTGRFKAVSMVTDPESPDAATSVVYVNSDYKPAANHTFGACVVKGYISGKTTTIGSGSGNAFLVLNANSNGTQGQITGGGTVAFGGARGYIISGAGVKGGINCGINAGVTGTGGVVFLTAPNGGITLYRTLTYSGGTTVLGGRIKLANSGNYHGGFGSGDVEICGGEYTGGTVIFTELDTQVSQNFFISGFGSTTGTSKIGALEFSNQYISMNGQITLRNDAMIVADDGCSGLIMKTIEGTGDLHLNGGGETTLWKGVDIDGDVYIDGLVTTRGSIATGERFLFVNGTLIFNNDEDITVDAKLLGKGRIELRGEGKVDFADPSVFEGTIDLCGNSAKIGKLWGIAKIEDSESANATLSVSAPSDYWFFGSFGPQIGLNLDNAKIGFHDAQSVPALSGCGTVAGAKLSADYVTPTGKITFDTFPGIYAPTGWRLKPVGWGAELAEAMGLLIQFK